MSSSQILRQARLQAALQFAPQISALHDQASQANTDLATGIAAQAAAAQAIVAQAKGARRPTKKVYDAQIHTDRATNATVSADLSKLGPNADAYRGAIDREQAVSGNNTTKARTDALQGLTDEATNATAGRAYAVANLLKQHDQNTQTINSKLSELAGERGAAASSDYMTLLDKAETRATARGNLNERVRHDQVTEGQARRNAANKRRAAAKKKTKATQPSVGLGSLTPTQESKIRDQIGAVVSVIKSSPAKDDGGKALTPALIRQHLMSGDSPLKKPVPGDIVNIAFDLAKKGGKLSAPNIRALHARGIHVPKQWLPANLPGVSPGMPGPPSPGL